MENWASRGHEYLFCQCVSSVNTFTHCVTLTQSRAHAEGASYIRKNMLIA